MMCWRAGCRELSRPRGSDRARCHKVKLGRPDTICPDLRGRPAVPHQPRSHSPDERRRFADQLAYSSSGGFALGPRSGLRPLTSDSSRRPVLGQSYLVFVC